MEGGEVGLDHGVGLHPVGSLGYGVIVALHLDGCRLPIQ
jgi:hypothetical protein